MDNLYKWIHDDITWCGNECSHLECERNMANRLTKEGFFSAALFEGTEMCPLAKQKTDTQQERKEHNESNN